MAERASFDFRDTANVRPFDGENFHLWKMRLRAVLLAKGVWTVVSGEWEKPQESPEMTTRERADFRKEVEKWTNADAVAQAIIANSLDDRHLVHLTACGSSHDMWTRLEVVFEQRSLARQTQLLEQYYVFKFDAAMSIIDNLANLESLVAQLKACDKDISETDMMAKIMVSLPAVYNAFTTAWELTPPDFRNLDELRARLVREEEKLGVRKQGKEALVVHSKKSTGHNSGSGSIGNSTRKRNNKNTKHSSSNRVCWTCGSPDHFKSKCPKREQNRSSSLKTVNANSVIQVASSDALVASSYINYDNDWIGDSGASDHISFRKEWFVDLKPSSIANVVVGGGQLHTVHGVGDVIVPKILMNGRWKENVPIRGVLFVPTLKRNLFSLRTMSRRQCRIIMEQDQLEVYSRDGELIASGTASGNSLWKMHFKMNACNSSCATVSEANVTEATLQVWHERFGHPNFSYLKDMVKSQVVDGLDVRDEDFDRELSGNFCEGCLLGKMTRRTFRSTGRPKRGKCGELLHLDTVGPMSPQSLDGYRFFLLAKDDCSGYRLIYFLKKKSGEEVLQAIKKMVTEATKYGHPIVTIRSDNGTEFRNKEVQTFLEENKISFEVSTPYCPEQNGVAERNNRDVLESAHSMLLPTSLPRFLWPQACLTACYLLNRTINRFKKDITPFEFWTGRKPDVRELRTFGSEVYVHIPHQLRGKWETKSIKMYLVGYDDGHVYRCWNPETRRVEKHTNVKIIERHCYSFIGNGDMDLLELREIDKVKGRPVEPLSSNPRQANQDGTANIRSHQYNLRSLEANIVDVNSIMEPLTIDEALSSPYKDCWMQAMKDELKSMEQHSVWTLVTRPENVNIVGCKWVYKVKRNSALEAVYPVTFKARLVARGFTQKAGIDFSETYSPVVRMDSIRTLLSLCASHDWDCVQFDVKTAFLYGDLDTEIFMEQPPGFASDGRVCKLSKSLYGLKQAPRQWNQKFHSFLVKFGFEQSQADNCVYVSNKTGQVLILALYVDDGLVFSDSKVLLQTVLLEMEQQFEIKYGDLSYYVGIRVTRERSKREIFLDQEHYVKKVLDRYHMHSAKEVSTPSDPSTKMEKTEGDDIDWPYREAIGHLMYLSNGTRPDIAYSVSLMSQFVEKPQAIHRNGVVRILKYLIGTSNYGLIYSGHESQAVITYSDADFAGDIETRRSRTGLIVTMNGAAICWKSRLQQAVSTSTTEAEFIACCEASKELIWLQRLLANLGHNQDSYRLLCDNRSAVQLIKNPGVFHQRSKHIDIQYKIVCEQYSKGMIDIGFIGTEDQLADLLTKSITKKRFNRLRWMIGVRLPLNDQQSSSGSVDDNGDSC